MENPNIYLVRSPSKLVEDDLAGYGWSQVNFSDASTPEELLELFAEKGVNPGRRRKQVKRFFGIAKGDIVVVPLHKSVAIGYATGTRSYAKGVGYGENRVGVKYLRNQDDQSIVRVPRSKLLGALATRLRIRMSVVSLNEFREEILRAIDQIETGGGISFDSHIQALEADTSDSLQERLITNIRSGKTNLESGGLGLEKLVSELLELEGYSTKILSKTTYKGRADADIKAFRKDRLSSNILLVQVKHHDGVTGYNALRQLQKIETEERVQRWIITTGDVSQEMLEEAESDDIGVMTGKDLVEWLIDQAHQLSPTTLYKLGLSTLPSLLL